MPVEISVESWSQIADWLWRQSGGGFTETAYNIEQALRQRDPALGNLRFRPKLTHSDATNASIAVDDLLWQLRSRS